MVKIIEKEISQFINKILINEKIDFAEFHGVLWFYSNTVRSEEYNTKQIQCLIDSASKYDLQKPCWAGYQSWLQDPITNFIGFVLGEMEIFKEFSSYKEQSVCSFNVGLQRDVYICLAGDASEFN